MKTKLCFAYFLQVYFFKATFLIAAFFVAGDVLAAEHKHSAHRMHISAKGSVMNNNHHTLPWGCTQISEDLELLVHAGRAYAQDIPGVVFGMSQHEYRAKPCARISITFVNDDAVRHQWMVHGLPKYLYPTGMFHLEAMAGETIKGTFIVPDDNQTYLVHCDIAQHMEKGMKGQLLVGKGNGDLWGIPGKSDSFRRSSYLPEFTLSLFSTILSVSFICALWYLKR